MLIKTSKGELYDLYNLLNAFVDEYEIFQDSLDISETISEKIQISKGITTQIRNLYQGLKNSDVVSLNLTGEEALIIVELLIKDIKEHEEKIGVEEDPTSHHAERAYNMDNLKKRIQACFKEKFHNLSIKE